MTALAVCFLALLAFFYAQPSYREPETIRVNETIVPKSTVIRHEWIGFPPPLPEANPRR